MAAEFLAERQQRYGLFVERRSGTLLCADKAHEIGGVGQSSLGRARQGPATPVVGARGRPGVGASTSGTVRGHR